MCNLSLGSEFASEKIARRAATYLHTFLQNPNEALVVSFPIKFDFRTVKMFFVCEINVLFLFYPLENIIVVLNESDCFWPKAIEYFIKPRID